MTPSTLRLWTAAIASFGVYLVPIVGPHAFYTVGEMLVGGIGGGRRGTWLAVDIAVALAAQVVAWLVIRWSLDGSALRRLAWLGVVPMVMVLNVAYLSAIPSYFLIEPDTAPETSAWPEHCVVRGASLMPIRTGVHQPAEGWSAWWTQKPDGGFALLRVPDCSLAEAAVPRPTLQPGGRVDFMIGLSFAAPDGAAVVERLDTATGQRSWFVLREPQAPLQPLLAPTGTDAPPVLSRSGDAVAWTGRVEGSGPPVLQRVLLRKSSPLSGFLELDVELAPLGPASYALVDLDTAGRQMTLWRNDQPLVLGFDGQARRVSLPVGEIQPQATTYLSVGDGWVAWDAYRDDGPYEIAWSIGSANGRRRTTNGRSITSAAVDPTGTYIAVSETTRLSIGDQRDVVYVLRTDTGTEVFRRYLPRYARSTVAFFRGGLFGYSDLDGTHLLNVKETRS